jgi:mono/diheme cytochrome c family protein
VDVFNSIYRGRAKGMPAWGPLLTEDQIWKLVAYVHSLGGATGSRYAGTQEGSSRKAAANTVER